jgi:cell division protein FtsB
LALIKFVILAIILAVSLYFIIPSIQNFIQSQRELEAAQRELEVAQRENKRSAASIEEL